jgi:hypothetical protein
VSGRKAQTETERLVAILEARRAAAIARGDPRAIRRQAAIDAARAEQREDERRERDRILRLLKGKPGRRKLTPNQKRAAQRQAAEKLIADILSLKRDSLPQAFRDYAQARGIKTDSAETMYYKAKTLIRNSTS